MVTIRQVKAARALLGWSAADLAAASGVSEPTLWRLESADGELGGRASTIAAIERAFETAGIEFISASGVRLGKSE
jgi:transcriptional regulator with XRE-family HTH domain